MFSRLKGIINRSKEIWSPYQVPEHDCIWLDLGPFSALNNPGPSFDQWQDHGLGLLRTILHQNSLPTDIASIRCFHSWNGIAGILRGHSVLLMNVRSYTYPLAVHAARLFKKKNPHGIVIVGGVHATVAPGQMAEIPEFDIIVQGSGENCICDIVRDPSGFPRTVMGKGAAAMDDWPAIERSLWPRPAGNLAETYPWPLEPSVGWGPAPVATMLTSRICPWNCAFCNENMYLPAMKRRSVDRVIDELNDLDERYGPLGSVVFHDSLFFQNPAWLREFLEKYPKKANRVWPYWAAARADMIRSYPDIFEDLIRETGWNVVSVGFESGSDRVLEILNKECSEEDNRFAIALLNRIGDEMEREGKKPPAVWANAILGTPGETQDDAEKTLRMLHSIRRVQQSVSFFTPYPGSLLGYQLTAEGKSLLSKDTYHRNPGIAKVRGVDYAFYESFLSRVNVPPSRVMTDTRSPVPGDQVPDRRPRSRVYLFSMKNGKKKIAYGSTPRHALEILAYRLSKEEMDEIDMDRYGIVTPREIMGFIHELG
jgi:radical SAM superfamily enzyme YgiQ (UPF0313 family)